MQRQLVSSTSLRSVGYDPENQELEIEFTSGKVYRYHHVSPEVYAELMQAESLGQFFNAQIRDNYPFEETSQK